MVTATYQVLSTLRSYLSTYLCNKALEAWFFDDAQAISKAYPKIKETFATQRKYRLPDEIKGGTWEALERLLRSKGYHPGGLNKVEAARDISIHMTPEQNRSVSFQCFCSGLISLVL